MPRSRETNLCIIPRIKHKYNKILKHRYMKMKCIDKQILPEKNDAKQRTYLCRTAENATEFRWRWGEKVKHQTNSSLTVVLIQRADTRTPTTTMKKKRKTAVVTGDDGEPAPPLLHRRPSGTAAAAAEAIAERLLPSLARRFFAPGDQSRALFPPGPSDSAPRKRRTGWALASLALGRGIEHRELLESVACPSIAREGAPTWAAAGGSEVSCMRAPSSQDKEAVRLNQ
jgi:hypothetical protein